MTLDLSSFLRGLPNDLEVDKWSTRSRAKMRSLVQRWGFAIAGFVLGLVCVGWVQEDVVQALWQTEDAVEDLRGKLAPLQAQVVAMKAGAHAAKGLPVSLALLPTHDQQALIWPRLQQMLTQHDVRLVSLRPVPDALAAPVASQAIAVHMQGRFEDWVDAWSAMSASGPVWTIERLRITPRDHGVDMEAVLRVWLSDGLASGAANGWLEHATAQWPVHKRVRTAHGIPGADRVFLQPYTTGALSSPLGPSPSPSASAAINAVFLADPHDWPMAHVRLAGIWQDAQDRYAILQAGPHWVRARRGQRVTREGHTIERIEADRVSLRAAQGALEILTFAKVQP